MYFYTYLRLCEKDGYSNLYELIVKENPNIFVATNAKNIPSEITKLKVYKQQEENCNSIIKLFKNYLNNLNKLNTNKSNCDLNSIIDEIRFSHELDGRKMYITSFNDLFGKNAIDKMSDEEFLNKFFNAGRRVNETFKSLIMEMEASNFGPKARDGSCVNKGFAYCRKEKENKTAWWFEKKEISEDDAIKKAKEIRTAFIDIFNFIESKQINFTPRQFAKLDEVSSFDDIVKLINKNCKEVGFSKIRKWFKKYLFLIYPNVFYDCIGDDFIDITFKFLQVKDYKLDYFECCKEVNKFTRNSTMKNFELSAIIGRFSWRLGLDLPYKSVNKVEIDDLSITEPLENEDDENNSDFGEEKIVGTNIIYYGIPGCGKSYKLNSHLLSRNFKKSKEDEEFIIRTTFHPDYSNSDFVGQLMPIKNKDGIDYRVIAGPFTKALRLAIESSKSGNLRKVALVIEEINRGNSAAIFGDIFQILDRDENGFSEYSIFNNVIAEYFKQENIDISEKIKLPNNLFIFATMNTSDQNVFKLDAAFKRRWQMIRVTNEESEDVIRKPEHDFIVPKTNNVSWADFVDAVNRVIIANGLEEDRQIGYWFAKKREINGDPFLFANKVLEYLWNDVGKNIDRTQLFQFEDESFDKILKKYTDGDGLIFRNGLFHKGNNK
ncbi:MAG: AAA family ATPase [Bacilli bacterium]|nr:AAA family ATPase [Bacilli bacterium]